jgi:3D (Asp-Asp-Asp) domain-containing protein
MRHGPHLSVWLVGIVAMAATTLGVTGALAAGGVGLSTAPPPASGGAAIAGGGLAPVHHVSTRLPPLPSRHDHGRWLSRVAITEYWPAPESWFRGRLVTAPGLSGRHRIDWLYSATGVSMQGDGLGLDGREYHIDALGDGGWVTADGVATSPSRGWAAGAAFWRAGGYWRNRRGAVTFPLAAGGWSDGAGRRYVPLHHVTFAPGPSLPLHFYGSIAVDPKLIPLGSRVYVPAYRDDRHGGWFIAQDTGGAITGRHIDVYRPPPPTAGDPGRYLTGERIFVIRPRK